MTACKYRAVLFDLDGTLTDSGKGVAYCVRRALESMERPVPPPGVLRKFVGPPMFDSFTRLCGLNAKEAEEAILRFRSFYDGIIGNEVYAGIPELLAALRKAGAVLAVATSKPDSVARVVLGHFGLVGYFDIISAADESDHGGGKEHLIFPVLEKADCPPDRAVMIGDTRFDAAGAAKAGTDFIGVLYGYGTKREMVREGAKVFAPGVGGLYDLLLDKS